MSDIYHSQGRRGRGAGDTEQAGATRMVHLGQAQGLADRQLHAMAYAQARYGRLCDRVVKAGFLAASRVQDFLAEPLEAQALVGRRRLLPEHM